MASFQIVSRNHRYSKLKFERGLTAVKSIFDSWAKCRSPLRSPLIKKFCFTDLFPGEVFPYETLMRTNIFKFKKIWDSIVIIVLVINIGNSIIIVVIFFEVRDFTFIIVGIRFLVIWFIKTFLKILCFGKKYQSL